MNVEEAGQYRILLVDDVPVNIRVLTAALSGYQILIAKEGEKALAIISGNIKPDLILLDVEMPGMNGYEVCARIRSDKRNDDIPVIFLTAKTDKVSIVKGFAVGGQDYVTKPFDFSELVARVNMHLELKRSKEKLTALNAELEQRVEERTRDLTTTLSKLEATNKELDTFVYRASHDLKGPTASMLGLLNMAKKYQTAEESEGIHARMEQTIINLNKVLDKLILKNEINQVPVRIEPVDLKYLVDDIRKSMEQTFPPFSIIYESPDYPSFSTDLSLLKVILVNVLENALIFNSSGRAVIKIKATRSIDQVRISIEDNGDGIDHGIENKVFDLFFRGSPKSVGNGLGLYLVSKAVEKLGGTIDLVTQQGEYTRLDLTLPVIPA